MKFRKNLKEMKHFSVLFAVLLISGLINIASAQDEIDVQPDTTRPTVGIEVNSLLQREGVQYHDYLL